MAEFLVLMLVLIPLLMGSFALAQYLDVQAKTHEASRYATWERTAWNPETKPDEQIRQEIVVRVLESDAGGGRAEGGGLGRWVGRDGLPLVTALSLQTGESEPEVGASGENIFDALGSAAGAGFPTSSEDREALSARLQTVAINAALQVAGCYPVEVLFWPFGPCSLLVYATVTATEIFRSAMGSVFSAGESDFNPLTGTAPPTDFIAGIETANSGVQEVLAVAGAVTLRPCLPGAALNDLGGALASLSNGFLPADLSDKMELNRAGLFSSSVVVTARNLFDGAEMNYDSSGAVLTDTWAPADAETYQARIANLTAAERFLVAATVTPAAGLAGIGIGFGGLNVGPFVEGCDALEPYSPAPPDALPWTSGDLLTAGGDVISDVADNAINNLISDGSLGNLSSIIGATGLDGEGMVPPLTIQHPDSTDALAGGSSDGAAGGTSGTPNSGSSSDTGAASGDSGPIIGGHRPPPSSGSDASPVPGGSGPRIGEHRAPPPPG